MQSPVIGIPFTDPNDGEAKVYFNLQLFEDHVMIPGLTRVKDSCRQYDAVIGIPTGVWPTLKIVSDFASNAILGQFGVKRYAPNSMNGERKDFYVAENISWHPSSDGTRRPPKKADPKIPFLRVLLVDDLTDEGLTVQKAYPRIQTFLRSIADEFSIDVFMAWYKETSAIVPDFYGLLVRKDPVTGKCPWIVKHEEASSLRVLRALGLTDNDIPGCMQWDTEPRQERREVLAPEQVFLHF